MKFIELVPREIEVFIKEVKEVMENFPEIAGINIADILRFPTRSYEAAKILKNLRIKPIPHIRTIDHPLEKTIAIMSDLIDYGIDSILIITGDLPSDPNQQVYEISPITLTEALKSKFSNLNIYCGLDPYRSSIEKELVYCREKINAGADGFFTQAIFDIGIAKEYLERLKDTKLFIGISPVITEYSKNYWETRNNVVFPSSYDLCLEYNCELAKRIIKLAKQYNQHTYIMPIKVPVIPYLTNVLG